MTTEPRDPRVRELVFELVQAAPEPPPLPDPIAMNEETSRDRRPAHRLRVAGALVMILVVVAAAVALVVRRNPPEPPPVVGPPTTSAGLESTPDVAYVDSRGLVVRAAGSDREVVVATGSISAPRWSPSGRWIAYRRDDTLWVARADGSIREGPIGSAAPNYLSQTYAWSPRVDALAFIDRLGVRVQWYPGSTLADEKSVDIDPPVGGVERSAQGLAWSQEGRSSLAISMERRTHTGPGAPEASLWLATGVCGDTQPAFCSQPDDLRRLAFTPGPDEYPLFLAGVGFRNRHVLIWPDYIGSGSVALDGLPLKAVPVAGGPVVTIGTTLVRESWVRPGPGGELLFVRSDGRMVTDNREVGVCEAPDRCRALAPGRDVQTLDPAWSADGKRIAFVREENAASAPPEENGNIAWAVKYRTRKLWIANTDGSDAHELSAAGGGVADPQFSSDGNSIVFVRDARLWQLDLGTSRVAALSGSMRTSDVCAPSCLPDAAVYETEARWSDHVAVRFVPFASTPVTVPGSPP